jgi:hypothetical protein
MHSYSSYLAKRVKSKHRLGSVFVHEFHVKIVFFMRSIPTPAIFPAFSWKSGFIVTIVNPMILERESWGIAHISD